MAQTAHERFMAAFRKAREESGLSVRALAAAVIKSNGVAISPSYITDIEKGRGIPEEYLLSQMTEAMDADLPKLSKLRARAKRERSG